MLIMHCIQQKSRLTDHHVLKRLIISNVCRLPGGQESVQCLQVDGASTVSLS